MLELFVGLVDRLIKIVELRQTDRRQLFKEVAEPLFNQLQPVVGKTGKTEKLGGTIFPIFRVHHSCRRTALGPYLIDMLVMLPPTGQVKRDAAERGKVSEKKKEYGARPGFSPCYPAPKAAAPKVEAPKAAPVAVEKAPEAPNVDTATPEAPKAETKRAEKPVVERPKAAKDFAVLFGSHVTRQGIEVAAASLEPRKVRKHSVVVAGKTLPVCQFVAAAASIPEDRKQYFTSEDAKRVLTQLQFAVVTSQTA